MTGAWSDQRSAWAAERSAIAPERPVFLYYAPGCAHAPHQAPKEWIDRYRGRFDAGYEAMCEEILGPGRRSSASSRPPPTCRR
ncbi:hypothetical protein [Kitasatospora sp. DSM 101779]|uniref:hypothetical protein n=1 Tax=Kitasatospora sp. DSM 101779 TaxID=2853165 RepID=UPI003985E740